MTNRSKAKGTAWETATVTVLHEDGHDDARRVTLAGALDQGDIHVGPVGRPLVVIESKNEQRMAVAEYVDEANREAANASATLGGVAWIHRRGKGSPRDGYVVMDGHTWLRLLAVLSHAAAPPARSDLESRSMTYADTGPLPVGGEQATARSGVGEGSAESSAAVRTPGCPTLNPSGNRDATGGAA